MASALGRAVAMSTRELPRVVTTRKAGMVGAECRGLKTNPYVEEWMGKREITEKTFTFTPKASFGLVMTIIVFPVWVYGNIKAGMEKKDVQTLGEKREYF